MQRDRGSSHEGTTPDGDRHRTADESGDDRVIGFENAGGDNRESRELEGPGYLRRPVVGVGVVQRCGEGLAHHMELTLGTH